MTSLIVCGDMWTSHSLRSVAFLLLLALAACGKGGSPAAPTPPPGPDRAVVAFGNVAITGSQTSSGFEYRSILRLQESAGVAVTVTSVELTTLSNGASLTTHQFGDAFATKIPAGGFADSKALVVGAGAVGSVYASHITTRVQFVDDKANTGVVTRTDPVPSLAATPTITTWSVTPSSIIVGQSSSLQWSVADSTSVTIDNGIGAVGASGQRTVSPSSTTTYIISATNSGGTSQRSVTLTVGSAPPPPPAPTVSSFSVDRTSITIGQSVTFSWCADGATSVSISGVGSVSSCGNRSFTPLGSREYVLSATNAGGTTTRSVTVTASVPAGICAAADVQAGATAICRDGTKSESQNRQGTCSSHGGVSCWVCPGALCNGAVAGERADATVQSPRFRRILAPLNVAAGTHNPHLMSVIPASGRTSLGW